MSHKLFDDALKYFMPVAKLTHRQKVMRMYRLSLRTLACWAEDREIFNIEGLKMQAEFKKYKDFPEDSPETRYAMEKGAKWLDTHKHPDPIIAHYMPGGSSFMRNPTYPNEITYDFNVPATASKRRVNIDMSNIPDDQPYANKVFVDSVNKRYYIDI